MLQTPLQNIRSVLCLGAHSDDVEIGCGGAVLELLRENPEIAFHWVVFSGEGRRAEEAQRSADGFLAGARKQTVEQKNFRDSFFPAEWSSIKEYVHELAERVSPDLIFTHRRDDLHQDHRIVSELTWCAFRDHLIFEYEIPKYEGDLGHPNVFFSLSEETCRRKIIMLLECFESQLEKPCFTEDTFRSLMRLRGLESNSPSRYAEAFTCRKMVVAGAAVRAQTQDAMPESRGLTVNLPVSG